MKIEPIIKTDLEESSSNDESIKQQATTVNIGSGATYNQNCGNSKKEFSRLYSTLLIIGSILISFLVVTFNVNSMSESYRTECQLERQHMENKYQELVKDSNEAHNQILIKAKEGTIWLLRHDILKMLDLYSQTKVITKKQFKCVKDEFEYYKSIGGNHDVEERYDEFVAKIFGTGEIKMINASSKAVDSQY